MIKRAIIGGAVTLIIGGTGYTISQTDVINNFSKETGMSQEEAKKYVDNAQGNLQSFSKIGNDLIADGNDAITSSSTIDCANYRYGWESDVLTCEEGKQEMLTVGNSEVTMGNCYLSLDSDLKGASKAKISECITDIDTLNSSYDLPIINVVLTSAQITDGKNSNLYNKSVLEAALQSK